jgi:hypothetical protein
MKSLIGQYGKIIIVVLAAMGILIFAIGQGTGSFQSLLPKPVASMGKEDSQKELSEIINRPSPMLSVSVNRLNAGTVYNLLDKDYFKIKATNADGKALDVSVQKIVGPDGKDVSVESADVFTPDKGVYKVTYYTEEIYQTLTKSTDKTYTFVSD